MEKSIAELRETFKTGGTKSISWRKSQLKALLQLINQNEDSIFKALDQDLGKSPVESYRDEVGVLKKSVTYTLSCLEKWVAPKKAEVPLLFFPAKAEVMPQPLGVTIPKYLDNKAVKVLAGGADIGERLLQLKWDKIFFT
ncbi:hypothetical protein Godav_020487, partial [Gossypium davidsonii]|nr:hypothetical protein [Gossypium davidsonii]